MGRGFGFGVDHGGPVGGESEQGPWYNTWQFALELYFHERLLRHPCVTERKDLATAFFLPYYAGMDLSRRFTHRLAKDELYMNLGKWLQGRESWKLREGRDHFMVLGRIASDFHREGGDRDWGNRMLRQKAFKEMVVVAIEHTYGRFREGASIDNEIAIPYPTYFHASSDGEIQSLIAWLGQGLQRVSLATMAAGQRSPSTNKMRYRLMTQCGDDPRCTLLRCVGHESSSSLPDQIGNISSSMKLEGKTLDVPCNNPQVLLNAMHQSEFCLQPPGDSPTRRSFFDSMLVGCIPVIFHREAAWSQYVHHLPENGESYSVFIPMALAIKSNVLNILSEIKESKIKEMRANIAKLIPRILYARLSESPTGKSNSADQTLDAFDIALDQVLKRITSRQS